jgi:hypothetical protein
MIRSILVVLCMLALLLPGAVQATAQIPDTIEVNGEKLPLNTNPLSAHLERIGWAPPEDTVASSANWRGYVARWRIDQDQLVLASVTIAVSLEGTKELLPTLFPDVARVVADWYSGTLVIPDGSQIRYVHMGYGSTYDHYQLIRVEAGKVVERQAMDAAAFAAYRAAKFEAYQKTAEFQRDFADARKNGMSKREADDFLRSFSAEQYLSH